MKGENVSGIMHVTSSSCFSEDIDIPVTGTRSDTISLNLSFPGGQSASFTNLTHTACSGTPGGTATCQDYLYGNYNVTAGACISASQGQVEGSDDNFSNDWSGLWQSSTSTSPTPGILGINLIQTGPDAHGFWTSTGTVSFTGGICFSDGTIDPSNSLVLGRGSRITVLSTNPPGGTTVITGDFLDYTPLQVPTFSGTYTSNLGACSDSGILAINF